MISENALKEILVTKTATVTALIENAPAEHNGLHNEHGLSFHVAVDGLNILFDCGASDKILHNARVLGIALKDIDLVVLSHSHYDHGGGFRSVAAESGVSRVVTGEGYFLPKYSREGIRHAFLGVDFDEAYLAASRIGHEVCGDLLQLGESCWAVGNFLREAGDENIPEKFVVRKDGAFLPDAFADEVCLAVRMGDGVAVLAGCAHPGILNILDTVEKRLRLPVRAVWGGTHLVNAGIGRVRKTLARLREMGVELVGMSHCSGDLAPRLVEEDGQLCGCPLRTGDAVEIRIDN